TGFGHALPEVARVPLELVPEGGRRRQAVEAGDHRADDGGRHGVAEQVGARAVAQQLDDLAVGDRRAAAGSAERLPERRGNDVYAVRYDLVLRCAAAGRTEEARRVAVVDHDERLVAVGELSDVGERGDVAVHAEHAVGRDQARSRALRLLQAAFEVLHVAVAVAQALRLGQADAVD